MVHPSGSGSFWIFPATRRTTETMVELTSGISLAPVAPWAPRTGAFGRQHARIHRQTDTRSSLALSHPRGVLVFTRGKKRSAMRRNCPNCFGGGGPRAVAVGSRALRRRARGRPGTRGQLDREVGKGGGNGGPRAQSVTAASSSSTRRLHA